jgi:glycogen debranching enzyme
VTASSLPSFDIREIPFSRRGSWLDLSPVVALHTSAPDIHLVSHVTGMHAVLRLTPVSTTGERLETQLSADPSVLTWTADGGRVRAAFADGDVLRIEGRGLHFSVADAAQELTPFTGSYFFRDAVDGAHVFTSYETGRRYRVSVLRGEIATVGEESLGRGIRSLTVSGEQGWEIAIEQLTAAAEPSAHDAAFDDVVAGAAELFREYEESVAGWRTSQTPAASLAAYVLWSATVDPAGFLRRESVLMSKHWMDKVWSWDHAFNALALAPGLPGSAWDQFSTPFDHQDATGALPDSVTHSEVLYNFVKPPIHGWALRYLRERLPEDLSRADLERVYDRLSRWSLFWLRSRATPGDALPYYQHGNDSGWDNATAFDLDRVVVSPDLVAFLALQVEVLADLADELQLDDGARWRAEHDRLRLALLRTLRTDDGFVAVGARNGRRSRRGSLLLLLPIVAADMLPTDAVDQLVEDIRGHVTPWGLATQRVDTPEYESDGYWRGPIWAPSTMLIENGLRRAGRIELADAVSERFRRLCELSGFAENFDALTGEGLRDRAYTWTASVYLVLAQEWVRRQGSP